MDPAGGSSFLALGLGHHLALGRPQVLGRGLHSASGFLCPRVDT